MKIYLTPFLLACTSFAGCNAEGASQDSRPSTTPKPSTTSKPSTDAAETPKAEAIQDIDVAGAAKLLGADDSVVVLDIRTPAEFAKGHIKGAVNIDYKADDFAEKLATLDKSKKYIMH